MAADGQAIHGPQQLDEFVLDEPVAIRGLGTKAALEKLDLKYRESCRKAGEIPLNLTYEVPAGHEQPLNLTLNNTFGGAVQEIAATSKLNLKRRGTTYFLQAPQKEDRLVRETYSVPPDFLSRVSKDAYERRLPIRAAIEKRGVSLDRSTRLTLNGSKLEVETRDRDDEIAISGLIESMLQNTPRQIRWEVRTFEIPSGQAWNGPAEGVIGGTGLADLRRIPGVQERVVLDGGVFSSPLRSGQTRLDLLPEGSLRSKARLLAFGVHAKAELKQKDRGRLLLEGQTPDGGTRISTTTRPDGSRIVLAVTPTIIDATGRPVKHRKR